MSLKAISASSAKSIGTMTPSLIAGAKNAHQVRFATVSEDVATLIFGMLTPDALAAAARVCKPWSQFLENEPLLWEALAKQLKLRKSVEPVASVNFASILRSCFLRGACEREWRRNAQLKSGIYHVETLQSHLGAVRAIQTGLDGGICTGSDDRTAKIWRKNKAGNWICEAHLKGHTRAVEVLQTGTNGKLYTGSRDRTAKIWGENANKIWICEATLEGHADAIYALHIGTDGKVYTGSKDGTIKIWGKNIEEMWICEATLRGNTGSITAFQIGPGGNVYTGSDNGVVRIWNKNIEGNWICEVNLEGHTAAITVIQVDREGRIYSGSDDKTVKIWCKNLLRVWHCEATLEGHIDVIYVLQLGADGRVYTGSGDTTARVWKKNENRIWICEGILYGHSVAVNILRLGVDGRVYTGSYDNKAKVWNKNAKGIWYCEATLQGHTRSLLALHVDVDGRVYTGSYDNTVKIWDFSAAEESILTESSKVAAGLITHPASRSLNQLRSPSYQKHKSRISCRGMTDPLSTTQNSIVAPKPVLSTLPAWNARRIALEFARRLSEDLKARTFLLERFNALPQDFRNEVYGKLYAVIAPETSGPRWGEYAFLHQEGHSSSPAEKSAAILTALAPPAPSAPIAKENK